jgi:hypothetical protein
LVQVDIADSIRRRRRRKKKKKKKKKKKAKHMSLHATHRMR